MKIFVAAGMVSAEITENMKRDAIEVGRQIGENGHTLMQGGSDGGVMGFVYNEFLKHSSDCEMITAEFFKNEIEVLTYSKAILTNDLNERLQKIVSESDKIVVLPGATGTLCELIYASETRRMGEHQNEIVVINSDGYYDGLKKQIETMAAHGYKHAQPSRIPIKFMDGLGQRNKLTKCTFCDRIKEIILMETKNFYVAADRFATRQGHLVICAKEHCNSAAGLSQELYEELIGLKNKCKAMLHDIYGVSPVCAEHGADAGRQITSRSIDHLHLHVGFMDQDAEREMITESDMRMVTGRAEFLDIVGSGSYIWYEGKYGKQLVTTKQMPKQYLRGKFAKGTPAEDDFVWSTASPETMKIFEANEAETISRVREHLMKERTI
jgi:hypothetical protein